jgi:predicted nucleic acid-binding protein
MTLETLWLDANVILRFLTGEPKELAERAGRLMARAERGEIGLFTPNLVVAEVVWVLRSFYRRSPAEIAEVLVALVSAEGIKVTDRATTVHALELARDLNVDFVDAVLALEAAAADATLCTLDASDFKRLPVRWIQP